MEIVDCSEIVTSTDKQDYLNIGNTVVGDPFPLSVNIFPPVNENGAVTLEECKMKMERLEDFQRELKLILAEMTVMANWLEKKFDTQILNRQSTFKHMYDSKDIERMTACLSLPHDFTSKVSSKPKRNYSNSILRKLPRKKLSQDKSALKVKLPGEGCATIVKTINSNKQESSLKVERQTILLVSDEKQESTVEEEEHDQKSLNIIPLRKSIEHDKVKKKGTETLTEKEANNKIEVDISSEDTDNESQTNEDGHNDQSQVAIDKDCESNKNNSRIPGSHKPLRTNKAAKGEKFDSRLVVLEDCPPRKLKRSHANWRRYACSGPKQCDECGKVVMGTSSLKQHKRMHADERPFECSQCGNRFRYRKNLKIHMIALHNGERHLQCSFCGKKFYAPKDLKIHENTHTGDKPHPCHLCPKRFNVKEHLTMHIRVHTGEKPYKCEICDKAFSQANSLRIHKKIHTREKQPKLKRTRKPNKKSLSESLLQSPKTESLVGQKVGTISSNIPTKDSNINLDSHPVLNIEPSTTVATIVIPTVHLQSLLPPPQQPDPGEETGQRNWRETIIANEQQEISFPAAGQETSGTSRNNCIANNDGPLTLEIYRYSSTSNSDAAVQFASNSINDATFFFQQ